VLAELLEDPEVQAEFNAQGEHDRIAQIAHAGWVVQAHPYQIPPDLEIDYTVFLMLAGRGAGKTRSAAEALWWWAWTHPNTMSIVLAPTSGDLKFTCFEGPSGLLACIPEPLVVDYNKQDHLIKLSNGSKIRGVSADSYDRLRGINSSFCWCDELAAYQYLGPNEAWDNMMLGLRIKPDDKPHSHPRVIVTTTPRPKDLILDLVGREGDDVVVSRASTYDNAKNLDKAFQKQLETYRGSKLYEQEVMGLVVDLEDGKVVGRDMFKMYPHDKPLPKFEYIVMSLDCAYTDKTYNDPTASTTWGVFKPLDGPMSVLLIDCWAEHLTFPQLKPKVLEEWRNSYGEGKDAKRPDLILVEAKASGLSLVQELQAMHLPVRAWNPGNADKMTRLQITASIFSTGRVWLPESSVHKGYVKDWAEGFLSQICAFPDAAHDDYVDATTQAMRLLKDMGFLDINPEPLYDDDDDYAYARKERVNPYAV
jgi:predicted phage terminase large subunit-like protein